MKEKRRPQQANNAAIEGTDSDSSLEEETSAKHMAHMSNSSRGETDKE